MNDIQDNEYFAKKEKKELEAARIHRSRRLKAFLKYAVATLILAGVVLIFYWLAAQESDTPEAGQYPELNACVQHGGVGMHIHPELAIKIKGENMEIPTNLGVTFACMRPIHTHDKTGVLHLEFKQPRDVKLGEFFTIWEKKFDSGCIFDYCNGPNGTVKMLVNGKENSEFENYIMRDHDKIEIIYE